MGMPGNCIALSSSAHIIPDNVHKPLKIQFRVDDLSISKTPIWQQLLRLACPILGGERRSLDVDERYEE